MRGSIAVAAALLMASSALHAAGAAPAGQSEGKPLYRVEGNKVDPDTLAGWKTWRALACDRCHGARQEGLVGPSLIESMKVLTKEQFKETLLNGRPERGMPGFANSQMVTENLDNLYAYLKGRSDGKIPPGRLEELK